MQRRRFHSTLLASGLILLALTAPPAGPTPLYAASSPQLQSLLCGYLAKAVAYLQTLRPSPLRDYLLTEAQRVYASRCS